jgi:hypothetical protein
MELCAKWIRVRWRSRFGGAWQVAWIECKRYRADDWSLWGSEWWYAARQ